MRQPTLTGTADSGAEVYAWSRVTGEQVVATADENGAWQAHFTFDLMPGDDGQAEVRDEAGNATAVEWLVPTSE